MSFAWYSHLKNLNQKPWLIAVLLSFIIASMKFFSKYQLNCIGFTVLSLAQLNILQEVIKPNVFISFALLYMLQPIKLDFL